MKENVVHLARFQWSLIFSRFYEIVPIGTDASCLFKQPRDGGVIAINWSGVFIIDRNEKHILDINFMEITGCSVNRNMDDVPYAFVITTVKGKDFQFQCQNCADVRELITYFLDGLKTRSKYAVAMQGNPEKVAGGGDGSKFLKFKKGDLIMLDEPAGDNLLASSWASGTNSTSAQTGDFPTDCVWVLPTLTKPHPDTVAMFKLSRSELESLASRAPQNQVSYVLNIKVGLNRKFIRFPCRNTENFA